MGVRLWGGGAYERETIDGGATQYKTLSRVAENDVVVNKIWARNGSVAVVPGDLDGCYVSPEFPTFAVKKETLEPLWFHWFTKTIGFWRQCDLKSHGTSGKNRIRPERFLEIQIPLPGIEEQRREVAWIEQLRHRVEEAVELRQKTISECRAITASTVAHLFSSKDSNGWIEHRLGDYVVDDRYGTSRKTTDEAFGTPIITMGNIQSGRLDLRYVKYLQLLDSEQALILQRGDILVNRTNSAELVGKCAVFDSDEEFVFASYLIRLRLNLELAAPRLIVYYLNSPLGRAYMKNRRKQMTGQANVSASKIKDLPISLPGLPEQQEIANYLDQLNLRAEEVSQIQERTVSELRQVVSSMVESIFDQRNS